MSTIAFPANSITRSQYDARQGQPLHRTYALLQQACPACQRPLRDQGYADWVRQHGLIVTLWACTNAPSLCEASRLNTTFRLETAVVDDPRPCFEEVDPETAEPFHCHRLAGHEGPHADWSPEECLVEDCACTEVEA